MTVKHMTLDDYDRVHALWMNTKGMGLNTLDDSREGIARFLKRNPTTCLIAEDEGALAGVLLAGHDGRRGYLYHMCVLENKRRKGVGGQLLDACLEALKQEGIQKAALVVFKSNGIGNAFWEKQGFTTRDDLIYRNRALAPLTRIDN